MKPSARRVLSLCGLGLALAHTPLARAESSPLGHDNPLTALLPSAPALRARGYALRAAQVERALLDMPGVQSVELLISDTERADAPLDQPAPSPRANVRIAASAGALTDAEIVRLVRIALPEVPAGKVLVLRSTVPSPRVAQAAADSARVGPFVVAAESASLLRATLAVCLGVNALLAALLLARRSAR